MTRFTVPCIALLSLLFFSLPARADETAPRVRFSATPETVRVVLDCPADAPCIDHSTPTAISFSVATPLTAALPAVTPNDPIVTGIAVTPDDQQQAVLTITLAKARKYHQFILAADQDHPFRVVIDILKLFKTETRQSLSPAITYLRLETQTEDRYLAAHFLDIDARQPQVHFSVTPAAGARERVCEMVTRTGAVCGVNGGYFMDGTRPVGLVKADGRILSLPLWARTAAAFPRNGAPIFDNPHGVWRIILPDHTTRDLPDWLDASVLTPLPSAAVVNGDQLNHTPAIPDGLILLIKDGKVASRSNAATPLCAGQWGVLLRGDDVKALGDLLPDGTPVPLTPVLQPAWAEYPNAIGAGPRLLRAGKIDISGPNERMKPDILTGRHARTGLGVTKQGHVIMAVVETPCPFGGGATLEELATLLQERGAVEAMNFDGGGSTSLALGGVTVNYPPNQWVRPVATGVLVSDDRIAPVAPKSTKPVSPDPPVNEKPAAVE